MPTNSERREVAARLRELDGWETETLSDTWYVEQLSKIVGYSDAGSMTERLADLIEPEERTCRMEPTGDGSVVCSACRTEYTSRWLHEGEYVERYYPNCGARVEVDQ